MAPIGLAICGVRSAASAKMLAQSLQALEQDGFLNRVSNRWYRRTLNKV